MKAYSIDLRQRVLDAVDAGTPRADVVRLFSISLATLKRWLQQRSQVGHLHAKSLRGLPRRIGVDHHAALVAQLRSAPDASLAEHCRKWQQEQETTVSVATMSRALRRAGWTRKKRT
jgi:transposase